MITNFEKITSELNAEELLLISPLVKGFESKTKQKPIKAPEIVKAMNEYLVHNKKKPNFTEARLRKCVNYIRTFSLCPLIATAKGYYVSNDKKEIEKQIKSLEERANSIQKCANGLKKLL